MLSFQRDKKSYKDLVFLITYIAYASIYVSRINLSMAGPQMKAQNLLTTEQIGFLGTAFSVIYAFGRLFNSMLADSKEPRTMIGIGLAFTGLSNLLAGLLPAYPIMLVLWSVNSFAQSMLWASVLRIIHAVYHDDERIRINRLSIVVSTVTLGQLAGILVSMLILKTTEIRFIFILPGLFELLMSGLVFLIYPKIGYISGDNKKKILSKIPEIMQQPEVRLSVFPCIVMGLLKDNVTLWMAVYFVDIFAINLSATAWYVFMIPLVGLCARLLFPYALRLAGGNEHLISRVSFLASVFSAIILITVHDPVIGAIALSIVYASMSMTNSSMLSIFPARFADQGMMASISGILDFVAYLGAGIGSTVYGLIIDRHGYEAMFISWAVLSIIAWLFMRVLTAKRKEQ